MSPVKTAEERRALYEAYKERFRALVIEARSLGMVVTIRQQHTHPLQTGQYETHVEIRGQRLAEGKYAEDLEKSA